MLFGVRKCHHRGAEMPAQDPVTQGFSRTDKYSSVCWGRQFLVYTFILYDIDMIWYDIILSYFGFFCNCSLDTWYRTRLSRQKSVYFPSTLPLIAKAHTYVHTAHFVELLAHKPVHHGDLWPVQKPLVWDWQWLPGKTVWTGHTPPLLSSFQMEKHPQCAQWRRGACL